MQYCDIITNKSKVVDGRHFDNCYIAKSSDFDEFWYTTAQILNPITTT